MGTAELIYAIITLWEFSHGVIFWLRGGGMALTPKQERFVQEYLVDLNATAAARRAGYSEKRASELGYQLLQKTTVQAAIQKAIRDRSQRTEVDQDYVIKRLKEISDKEASDAQDSDLKYSSKLKALELLGRHVGAFEPQEKRQREDHVRIIIDV